MITTEPRYDERARSHFARGYRDHAKNDGLISANDRVYTDPDFKIESVTFFRHGMIAAEGMGAMRRALSYSEHRLSGDVSDYDARRGLYLLAKARALKSKTVRRKINRVFENHEKNGNYEQLIELTKLLEMYGIPTIYSEPVGMVS